MRRGPIYIISYGFIIRLSKVFRRIDQGSIFKISYDLSYEYRKFIVRSTYDSDLTCAEISIREYRKLIDDIFDDITILHVNLTYEKLSVHCKMFCKLDVRRKLIVTLTLALS